MGESVLVAAASLDARRHSLPFLAHPGAVTDGGRIQPVRKTANAGQSQEAGKKKKNLRGEEESGKSREREAAAPAGS